MIENILLYLAIALNVATWLNFSPVFNPEKYPKLGKRSHLINVLLLFASILFLIVDKERTFIFSIAQMMALLVVQNMILWSKSR